jgi:prophage regulatory protein
MKSRSGEVASDTGAVVQKIYRRPQLTAVTGLSVPYINELVAAGKFPKPIKLGEKASGWLECDILSWQQARIAARDGQEVA